MVINVIILFILFFAGQFILLPLQRIYPQSGETAQQTTLSNTQTDYVNVVYKNHKDVYEQFGDNAVRLYQLHGAFALEFLKEYKVEGLSLLERYAGEMASLYPMLDYRDIFQLYNNSNNNTENLKIFSPEIIADFYKTFGNEGIKYITDNPENFFLISGDKEKGHELIQLANEKGDIVFPLVHKHGIAFAKHYDRDVLNIVIKFQEDGLLAIKEYGDKAKMLFSLFIDEETFYHVIKTYGHKQTIPIIYLFYDNKDFNSQMSNYLKITNAYNWLSSWWYGTDTATTNTQDDDSVRYNNARRGVNLIFELGNDFIDRFEIVDINNVKEEAVTIITNKLRNFFISDVEKVSRKRIRQEDITFQDNLFAGLDLLGFVPIGSGISKGAKFAAKGAQFTRTIKGFEGLANLTDDLVKTYGDDIIKFVAKHGDDGIKAVQATDGRILKLSQQYGDDVVRYVSRYGADAGKTIEKYGDDVLSLARQFGDDVIKYTTLYGDDALKIIKKHGKDVVLLSSIYGDNVIKLSIIHGDDVVKYASKYGSTGMKVIEKYGDDVMGLAKRYGDNVIKYVGMYGDDGLKLAGKGKAGLFIMRFMSPKVFAKCVKFIKYGLIATIFLTIATHPFAFLSGLINALAWLFGTSPVIIAIILGLVATFFLIRFLRRFKWVFTPFLVCFRILKRFV